MCFPFGYRELKKQSQTNTLEEGTQITRDLGIPKFFAFLVLFPFEAFRSGKFASSFYLRSNLAT